jgi:hypothetical protein
MVVTMTALIVIIAAAALAKYGYLIGLVLRGPDDSP